jgi:1-pyrroline-5-carboxylate dehydrogenase
MPAESSFKLTYATMFNPPQELHTNFEKAIEVTKANLGKEYPMLIGGKKVYADEKFEDVSPIDRNMILGVFQKGTEKHAHDALAAARAAFPMWSGMKWQERVALIRKAADLLDQRIYELGAAMALEVGKNRMESLGDIAETADLYRYPCSQMEENNGFIKQMLSDPLVGFKSTNYSILKPYGVWLVISPFNFPGALTGGPSANALVAGNTLVIKPSSDTPWIPYLIAEVFHDAGIPDGVVNFVTGPGSTLGQALVDSPEVDGITFTGSFPVGMGIYRSFAQGKYVRPIILEMGGKNPTIVSKNADLEDAALGIVRSAFGLQGQKCSACSRVFVQAPLYDKLVGRVVELTKKLSIGDPTLLETYMGPVINKHSYKEFQEFCADLSKSAKILTGGKIITDGEYANGYFCEPTVVVDVPRNHKLWKHEMFLPITFIEKVETLEEAMEMANDVDLGLTAGIYGSDEEVKWFFNNIQAGCNYANRPQGATTGAWPGYQAFGGWKGSGAMGKCAGAPYYLQGYMHEQSQTVVERE